MNAYYIMNVWDKDVLDVEDADEFTHNRDIHSANGKGYDRYECEWLVQEICEYFYHNRDGWEVYRTWQNGITVALWDENKKFIGKFSSTLEYEPTFFVTMEKQ